MAQHTSPLQSRKIVEPESDDQFQDQTSAIDECTSPGAETSPNLMTRDVLARGHIKHRRSQRIDSLCAQEDAADQPTIIHDAA